MAKGLQGLQGISERANQQAIQERNDFKRQTELAHANSEAFIRDNYLYSRMTAPAFERYLPLDVLPGDFGKSRFDSRVKTLEDVYDLDNFRAQEQTGINQIINGVAKGLTTAGTTFVSGILGTVYGLFNGLNTAFNPSEDNPNLNDAQEFLGGFVNNPVARTMQDFNNFMERWAPNYRSYEEQNTPWWKRLGTANFWADDIIKNVGFSVGSMGAALVWNEIGNMVSKIKFFKDAKAGIPAAADEVADIINNPTAGERVVKSIEQGVNLTNPLEYIKQLGTKAGKAWTKNGVSIAMSNLLGSTGEAQIEAIQASTDFRNSQLDRAKKYFTNTQPSRFDKFKKANPQYFIEDNLTQEGEQVWKQSEQNEFNTYKDKVEAEAIKMGNNIFLYQTALLTATNSYVYAKLFGAGYTTQSALLRRGKNFISPTKEGGKLVAKEGLAKWAKAGNRFTQGLMEAVEEMGQSLITQTSEDYFKHNLDDNLYYKDASSPFYNKKTADFLNSLAVGTKGSIANLEDWQQGVSGFLMGMLGVPFVGRKASGKIGLKMMGGIKESVTEYKDEKKLRDLAVSSLNEYLGKPENAELFKHMVLNLQYTDKMKAALSNGSEKDFKDNEHKALVATALTFYNAGRMKDFYRMIDNAADISKYTDEQIEELKDTAMTDEKGDSIYKDKTPSEIKEIVSKNIKEIRTKTTNFVDMTNHLTALYSNKFNQSAISNLAFNLSLSENQRERSIKLAQEVQETLNTVLSTENKITNTSDLNAILKSIESFAGLDAIKQESITLKELEDKAKAEGQTITEEQQTAEETTREQGIREKTGLTKREYYKLLTNLMEKSQKLIEVSGVKALGLEEKIIDLYLNIQDYKQNMKLYVQGVSNPTKYLETIAKYQASLVKEMHAEKIKNAGEIEQEEDYSKFINNLDPKDRTEFLNEHIKSNAKTKPYAEKILANDKLNEAANSLFTETNKEHSDEAKNALKQIFEANKEELSKSIKEGLAKIEEEVNKLNNPDVTKLLETVRTKISKIEEIKAFYNSKPANSTVNTVDTTKLDTEEIKKLKEEAIIAAKELIAYRAKQTDNEYAIETFFKGRDALISGKIPVNYLDAADEENITVDPKDKEISGTKLKPSIKVVTDYATNTTKVYLVKAKDSNIAQKTNNDFLIFAKNIKPIYEVKGWGITKEQFEAALKIAKVSIINLENVIDSMLGRGDLKSSWTNVPIAGDEEFQQNYSVIINKLNGVVEGARKESTSTEPQPQVKPVDDFVLLQENKTTGDRTGYKKTYTTRGDVVYTMYKRDKTGQQSNKVYQYLELEASPTFIPENELNRLPNVKYGDKIKLHKITENKTPDGSVDIRASVLMSDGKLVTISLIHNIVSTKLAEVEQAKANKSTSKFSGQWNFSVTEYDFRDEFKHQMAPTPISEDNERDLFIYDMLKANDAFSFVNSGDLYRLWEKDNNLPVRFKKINSDPTSSIHSVPQDDSVYFMYVVVNGKEQIVGSVKKGTDLDTKIKEVEAKGEEYVQTIRNFKAGDKGINEKNLHSVSDLTNSNNKPIIGLITLNADKSGPMLSTTGDRNISLDMIPGLATKWDEYKGKPFLLLPAANGTYIFNFMSPNSIGSPRFMKVDASGNLFLDYNAYPILQDVHNLLKTISNIKVSKGEDVQNSTYDEARAAIKELNKLFRFSDSDNSLYKLDLYYSKETGDYFVSLHEEGSSNKRRLYQDELANYKKYGNQLVKAVTPEAQVDSETPKSFTDLDAERKLKIDQFASATLDANSSEYNYKQLLALLNAINPLFNFDKAAFDPQSENKYKVNDLINNDIFDTTIALGRTYNGQFFLNDNTPASTTTVQDYSGEKKDQYITFGRASSTGNAFKAKFEYNGQVLKFTDITNANQKKLQQQAEATKTSVPKFDIKNSFYKNAFISMLKEHLQLNNSLSVFGEKLTNEEIRYYQIEIDGEIHYFRVTKETDSHGKFTYKPSNTVEMNKEAFLTEIDMALEEDFDEIEDNLEITIDEPLNQPTEADEVEPISEVRNVERVFHYTEKFHENMAFLNKSNTKKPITLKEFVEKIKEAKDPKAFTVNYVRDALYKASDATLKNMKLDRGEAIDLGEELERFADAVEDNNIKDQCGTSPNN